MIFAKLEKLINFLNKSEITDGYNGIRDSITPMFSEYFKPDRVSEDLRQYI